MISSDFESGLFYGNAAFESIALLNSEYDKIQKDSLPLFINFNHPQEQFQYISNFENQSDTYLLHPKLGFYILPMDIIQKKP